MRKSSVDQGLPTARQIVILVLAIHIVYKTLLWGEQLYSFLRTKEGRVRALRMWKEFVACTTEVFEWLVLLWCCRWVWMNCA